MCALHRTYRAFFVRPFDNSSSLNIYDIISAGIRASDIFKMKYFISSTRNISFNEIDNMPVYEAFSLYELILMEIANEKRELEKATKNMDNKISTIKRRSKIPSLGTIYRLK